MDRGFINEYLNAKIRIRGKVVSLNFYCRTKNTSPISVAQQAKA